MTFDHVGLALPTILLPASGTDMKKWAVIACDQYTSDHAYWQRVAELVGDAPSTLNLIFPEVFLEEPGGEERIRAINVAMEKALADGVLQEQKPGFILIDRKTSHAPSRKGLMVALDLEHYDYAATATTLIRATEGTILDRLPPRIKVREKAPLELPHIMVLIDDPNRTVIEPLFNADRGVAYRTELMERGGEITGYRVDDEKSIKQVVEALAALADPKAFSKRYEVEGRPTVLYAMGDGNHSFATAKAIWEKLKAEAADKSAIMNHPARYALVELVNVHDAGLEFEAIHRVLFGVDADDMLAAMERFYAAAGSSFAFKPSTDLAAAEGVASGAPDGVHAIPCVLAGRFGVLEITGPAFHLVVATLQSFLDSYLKEKSGVKIDYIHGDDVVTTLGSKPGNAGFYLPTISKHDLFKTVILDGALPRKTFSMGEADEKRFYLECRKIR